LKKTNLILVIKNDIPSARIANLLTGTERLGSTLNEPPKNTLFTSEAIARTAPPPSGAFAVVITLLVVIIPQLFVCCLFIHFIVMLFC